MHATHGPFLRQIKSDDLVQLDIFLDNSLLPDSPSMPLSTAWRPENALFANPGQQQLEVRYEREADAVVRLRDLAKDLSPSIPGLKCLRLTGEFEMKIGTELMELEDINFIAMIKVIEKLVQDLPWLERFEVNEELFVCTPNATSLLQNLCLSNGGDGSGNPVPPLTKHFTD